MSSSNGRHFGVRAWCANEARCDILEIVNGLEFGLSGSVWSRDIASALTTARRIQSGYIWINSVGPHYPGVHFGGFKASGTGREEGFDDMISYTEAKAINIAR